MKVYKRIYKLAGATAIALSLSACGMFSDPDPRYEPAELTDYAPAVSVSTKWSVSIGSGGSYGFAPVVVGDTAYAATPSGAVAAIELGSGALRWRTSTPALAAGVGSDGRTTAVVSTTGQVLAYDAKGQQVWETQAASAVNVPPSVGSGIVVVRTTDYRLQAFDESTGELKWEVQRPGPALALRTSARIIIDSDIVIAGMPNGRLMAIDVATGAVHWEGSIANLRGASDLERISDVVGQPVALGPLLCGVNYQGGTSCFDLQQGGRKIWSQNISSATGMVTDQRRLYLPGLNDTVYALNLESGDIIWQQKALLNRHLTAPAAVGSVIAMGDYQGYVHLLSRADGEQVGRLHLGSDPISSPPVATERGVLVQTGNGNLALVGVSG